MLQLRRKRSQIGLAVKKKLLMKNDYLSPFYANFVCSAYQNKTQPTTNTLCIFQKKAQKGRGRPPPQPSRIRGSRTTLSSMQIQAVYSSIEHILVQDHPYIFAPPRRGHIKTGSLLGSWVDVFGGFVNRTILLLFIF